MRPPQPPSVARRASKAGSRGRDLQHRYRPDQTGRGAYMSVDLLPLVINGAALDGSGGFFTGAVDTSYWSGYVWNNGGDPSVGYMYPALAKGGVYGLMIAAERNTDCGNLSFAWQYVGEDSPGEGFDLDGQGLIPGSTTGGFPTTFYQAGVDTISLNGAADKDKVWSGVYSQFRVMGDEGDPITADGVFSVADNVDHFDGGPGRYALEMTATDGRTPITALMLVRFTAEGFPTA